LLNNVLIFYRHHSWPLCGTPYEKFDNHLGLRTINLRKRIILIKLPNELKVVQILKSCFSLFAFQQGSFFLSKLFFVVVAMHKK